MPYFTLPYRVLFHDTMAYGSHHYVTNFKFQNIVRETVLFESLVNGKEVWKDQLKNLILLTREAYSLNLAPVQLGQRVGILLTYEDPSRSSVRLCFRVVREDGQLVSCGYQTMICADRDTLELVPAPPMVTQYLDPTKEFSLLEPLTNPGFAARLKENAGALKHIFSDEIVALGRHVATAPARDARPRILDEKLREYALDESGAPEPVVVAKPAARLPKPESGIVFSFPGQGSYNPAMLRALYEHVPEVAPAFKAVDDIARRELGQQFLALVLSRSTEEHDQILRSNQDLPQLGIYLADFLTARLLIERGVHPELLLGHSFGELAAAAIAGVFSLEEGAWVVCQRILALRASGAQGQMAAIVCGPDRTVDLLQRLGQHGLEIAVVNHAEQTVVSGPAKDIDRFATMLGREGILLTRLQSPFPFHSSHLSVAEEPFRRSLARLSFHAPRIPMLLGTDGMLMSPETDFAAALARQFTHRFDFAGICQRLYGDGYRCFVECGAGEMITKLVRKNFPGAPGIRTFASAPTGLRPDRAIEEISRHILTVPRKSVKTPEPPQPSAGPAPNSARLDTARLNGDGPEQTPIAIVSLGCVLPGAPDTDHFWHNIRHGVSGIVDLAALDRGAKLDFVAGSVNGTIQIVPDKTYTLLNGTILDIPYNAAVLKNRMSEAEFETLTRGQKLFALALGQTLTGFAGCLPRAGKKIHCLLGSTADGSGEFDAAAFVAGVRAKLEKLDEVDSVRESVASAIAGVFGCKPDNTKPLAQWNILADVVTRILPPEVTIQVIDSACSSSLYSIDLGIKRLALGDSDLVFAGGVFAPGPANNTLFAQFRGLSPTGSRPFDRTADGVVFGDGAAIIMLKRLTDALADGDHVWGVIRGIGLSSDGKSASVNVPQAEGQKLAVRRALRSSGAAPESIQYIEAHATATPVGDRVEVSSLRDVFAGRPGELPRIELGSVKALIGHTGWVSGAASVIKLVKAFNERIIPKQYNFNATDPEMKLADSAFKISTEEHGWPENLDGLPRRAGVNGFGFGGTNAHLIIEDFCESYHRRLCTKAWTPPASKTLAVVAVGSLFPAEDRFAVPRPTAKRSFSREKFPLPKGKMLLPDVTDHMDPSQFLIALAAEKALGALNNWMQFRDDIGVIVGLESKTERGLQANLRIFLDRLARLMNNGHADVPPETGRILEAITGNIRKSVIPSGPYTLPGLMPNVTASRVSNLFDLRGPNFVVDSSDASMFHALLAAEKMLRFGSCKVILAGGVNAASASTAAGAAGNEGVLLLALTTPQIADEAKWPVVATLDIAEYTESNHGNGLNGFSDSRDQYGGAGGATEILAALDEVGKGGVHPEIAVPPSAGREGAKLRFGARSTAKIASEPAVNRVKSNAYAYVQGTPIHRCTPVFVQESARASSRSFSLNGRRLLVLMADPSAVSSLLASRLLDAVDVQVVFPGPHAVPGALSVNLDSDEHLLESLARLDERSYDTILAVGDFRDDRASFLLEEPLERISRLVDLLFGVCRRDYERLRSGKLPVISLSLGAVRNGALDPQTGLVAGFMKSLGRELPEADITLINTDESNILTAFAQVEAERVQAPHREEVCYIQGARHVVRLRHQRQLASDQKAYLTKRSVVLATGGGRGVTAVLAEQLLLQFGCTVVAVGRTDPDNLPAPLRAMSEEQFRAYEAQFYKSELARDPTTKIRELKKRYASLQAAHEVSHTVDKMRTLPGRFEYHSADIGDSENMDRLIQGVCRDHGGVDLVLHGAGIQVSGMLSRKTLAEFRNIIATKLASIGYIYRSLKRHLNEGKSPHYHLLTSAFSFMGNDGQPDYGAANESLNRLSQVMNKTDGETFWSSMGWLGWAGIGMTRGSEFAALAASRRLRGVTGEEGKAIFAELMSGTPCSPINILIADGEIRHYGIVVEEATESPSPKPVLDRGTLDNKVPSRTPTRKVRAKSGGKVFEWEVNLQNAPFLWDHMVNGIPTMPAAFFTCMVAEGAQKTRPDLKVAAFENTHYRRFVRVSAERGVAMRVHTSVISEDDEEALVRVQIFSDFTHKSGRVLQSDIVHNETTVRMLRHLPNPSIESLDLADDQSVVLPDPYVISNPMVQLKGQFASTREIRVGSSGRLANYQLIDGDYGEAPYAYLLPNMIMVDAFWRFGTVQLLENGRLAVYVPERCGVMRVFFDYVAFQSPRLHKQIWFRGENPRVDGDLLHVGPISALDDTGHVLLRVENGVCRKFGELEHAAVVA